MASKTTKDKLKSYWQFFSNIGINVNLGSAEIHRTRLVNQYSIGLLCLIVFSFCFQVVQHLIISGKILNNSILMLVSFLPFLVVPILNYKQKYFQARVAFIVVPILNIIFWIFLSTGQSANIHYVFLMSPIPIVILFKNVRTQVILIVLNYLAFLTSHLIIQYFPPVVMSYSNPHLTVIVFGIWLGISFSMLRFFTRELLDSEKKLHLKNKELEDFAHIASHDLKEPLRTISSFSSLLLLRHTDEISEDAKEYLDFISSGAKRMNSLITDLSSYSMVTKDSKQSTDVNLNDILLQVKNNLQASISASGTIINSSPLPTIKASSNHMIQLFQNIISNSIKFQPLENKQPPVISIKAQPQGEFQTLQFTDNGIGIPKEHLDQIFTKFKRLHNREQYDGTGLGLATCKKIIEHYHGKIIVESEINEGTTISLFFMN